MDTAEEAHDYDAMDHSAVNRVFVDDFLAVYAVAPPGPFSTSELARARFRLNCAVAILAVM